MHYIESAQNGVCRFKYLIEDIETGETILMLFYHYDVHMYKLKDYLLTKYIPNNYNELIALSTSHRDFTYYLDHDQDSSNLDIKRSGNVVKLSVNNDDETLDKHVSIPLDGTDLYIKEEY